MNSSTTKKKTDELFVVAKITGCFGIKGFVKVTPLTHSPERLNELENVLIGKSDAKTSLIGVEKVNFQHRNAVMKFFGVDDRNAAELLLGNYLFVRKKDLVPPPEGSWFIHDIIGCEVFDSKGATFGVIKDVWKMPGNDLWEISCDGRSVMFPSNKRFLVEVDISQRRIVIAPPEGLFEI